VLHIAVSSPTKKGLAAMSMRKLADDFGAGAMSLYQLLPEQDALLDEDVRRRLRQDRSASSTDEDSEDGAAQAAISTRAALTRHL
jgi:AcrR family transcriptional regulator